MRVADKKNLLRSFDLLEDTKIFLMRKFCTQRWSQIKYVQFLFVSENFQSKQASKRKSLVAFDENGGPKKKVWTKF